MLREEKLHRVYIFWRYVNCKSEHLQPAVYQKLKLKIFLVQAQTVDAFYSMNVPVLYLHVRNELWPIYISLLVVKTKSTIPLLLNLSSHHHRTHCTELHQWPAFSSGWRLWRWESRDTATPAKKVLSCQGGERAKVMGHPIISRDNASCQMINPNLMSCNSLYSWQ